MSFDSKFIYGTVSYDFKNLIRRAESGSFPPPSDRQATTASGFACWIYSLQHSKIISSKEYSETFKIARQREIEIASLLAGLDGIVPDGGRAFKAANQWERVYIDPLLENHVTEHFEASILTVMGAPIRCRPDVVLFNTTSGELLIVERKVAVTSNASIPSPFYPNVLAQLWCYSQINFAKAQWPEPREVLLAADLWTHRKNESVYDGRQKYRLWRKGHRDFKYVRPLFELYGGLVAPKMA